MLDKWFLEDLKECFSESNRVVIVDENEEYSWLVNKVKEELPAKIFTVDDQLDDLEVKYRIEAEYDDQPTLIYSKVDPYKERNARPYMIQEYIATGISFQEKLSRYIKEKTKLDLKPEDLVLAGELSTWPQNKNQKYWDNLRIEGEKAIFGDFDFLVLGFLNDPDGYYNALNEYGQESLYQLFAQLIGEGNILRDTPPETVAQWISKKIFDDLINENNETRSIYKKWIDSKTYRGSLEKRLREYEVPKGIDPWKVSPSHPFRAVDEQWLTEIVDKILDNRNISEEKKELIKSRSEEKEGCLLASAQYWAAVSELLSFEGTPDYRLESIESFINAYTQELYKLDQALRHIQTLFLNKENALKAFQSLYQEKMKPYLNKWRDLFKDYEPDQNNYILEGILKKSSGEIAIIVGDAIRLEVAEEIRNKLSDNDYELNLNIVKGDYPSTTKNNMSSLFGSIITDDKKKREETLQKNSEGRLDFDSLDRVSGKVVPGTSLILYSSDVDDLSEKGQEKALKYYDQFVEEVAQKIEQLMDMGYSEVHLVTDHGFLFNFNVPEAEKIAVDAFRDKKPRERYLLSNDDIEVDGFIKIEKSYEGYNYIYFPLGLNPLRTRGKYGFAHGGISPQELLLPHLTVNKRVESRLKVWIKNKKSLEDISSDNIDVVIESQKERTLFQQERRIVVRVISEDDIIFSTEKLMKANEKYPFSCGVGSHVKEYKVQVLDATTKQIIDEVKGRREELRRGLNGFDND